GGPRIGRGAASGHRTAGRRSRAGDQRVRLPRRGRPAPHLPRQRRCALPGDGQVGGSVTAVKSADITLLETVDDVGADRAAEIEAIHEVLHGVRGPFQVLLHCPGLAEKVMRAGAHIRLQSTLTPRQRQLVIAALARAISCNYEWAAHIGNARKAGIDESTLELIRTGGDLASLPDG